MSVKTPLPLRSVERIQFATAGSQAVARLPADDDFASGTSLLAGVPRPIRAGHLVRSGGHHRVDDGGVVTADRPLNRASYLTIPDVRPGRR
jgi:hypothetical protein